MQWSHNKKILNHCFEFIVKSNGTFVKNVELLDFSNNWVDEDTWQLFDNMVKQVKNVADLNLSKLEPGDFLYFENKKVPEAYQDYTWGDTAYGCLTNCMMLACCQKAIFGCCGCAPKKLNVDQSEK